MGFGMTYIHNALFQALSDPTRRALFENLCREGEQTVSAMTHRARISQPAVSKHLRILKDAGLVRGRSAGRQTHYRAMPASLAALDAWVREMTDFWHARFDDLDDLLKRMDQ
jgi:DNA-binding transcriptional ArsR family regulator